MNPVIQKTFGGLSRQYYIRQFLFGLIFPAIFYFVYTYADEGPGASGSIYFFCVVNTILYPYSRFVYESIVNYILGDTFIISSVFVMALTKIMTMALCWSAAIMIAPVGLAHLYFFHTKNERLAEREDDLSNDQVG